MDTITTKELARRLGLLQTVFINERDELNNEETGKASPKFQYAVILDFESTCWGENKAAWRQPEIIEFPAVLLNLQNGQLQEEFQQYVMPTENPQLSDFCKELTGIQQQQVNEGVPLGTCLMLFNKWLEKIAKSHNIVFGDPQPGCKACTFVTWSDWDLAVCLHKECFRKNISKPEVLTKWIDLRAVYREFYNRLPHGLKGALSDVGLGFEGREHSGLCDAQNTAHLLWKMVCDGVHLRITRDLQSEAMNTHCKANEEGRQSAACNAVENKKNEQNKRHALMDISESNQRKPFAVRNSLEQIRRSNQHKRTISECDKSSKRIEMGSSPVNTTIIGRVAENKRKSIKQDPVNEKENELTSKVQRTVDSPAVNLFQRLVGYEVRTPKNNTSLSKLVYSLHKKTPPLCRCGRRAARKMVSMPGPNQGKSFFACPNKKALGVVRARSGCGFFMWEA